MGRQIITSIARAYLFVCLLVAIPAHVSNARFQFRELRLDGVPALQYGGTAWGDIDGDGDYDIVTSGSVTSFENPLPVTRVYLNEGDFIEEIPDPGGGPPTIIYGINYRIGDSLADLWRSAVALGDYDGDGDLDLVATGLNPDGIRIARIYENVGGFDLFRRRYSLPGLSDGDVAWADYDNDGDLDFVMSGIDDAGLPNMMLYENQVRSGAGFVLRDAGFVGLTQSSLAWGDYDNDQDLDLLASGVTHPTGWATVLYRNDGSGSFSQVPADLCQMFGASVSWGDYDTDGDLDILISGGVISPFLLEGKICIYENIQGEFFGDRVTMHGSFEGDRVSGRYRGSAAWGDFNNDGRLDFLINGLEGPQSVRRGQVFENVGGGIFTKPGNEVYSSIRTDKSGIIPGAANGSTIWGDYDNDGDLDILSQGTDPARGSTTVGLQNFRRAYPSNSRPQPPTLLSVQVLDGAVELSWSPGSDSSTPVQSLTYNLRIGTAPGTGDIVSAMADVETGRRLFSSMGNAQHNLGWHIQGLEPGTYYWSVQTIDSSFFGSVFSEEASFTIPE